MPSIPSITGFTSGAFCTGLGLVVAQALVANAINSAPLATIFGRFHLSAIFDTIENSLLITGTYNYLSPHTLTSLF
jgi:hypothetical protein